MVLSPPPKKISSQAVKIKVLSCILYMNKDLRDPFASFRTRVSDALTPTNRLKLSKSTRQMGLGGFGAVLVGGRPWPLTHRSIPLSLMGGYVSVTGTTNVCDERK